MTAGSYSFISMYSLIKEDQVNQLILFCPAQNYSYFSEGFTVCTHATSPVPKPSRWQMKNASMGRKKEGTFRENGRGGSLSWDDVMCTE